MNKKNKDKKKLEDPTADMYNSEGLNSNSYFDINSFTDETCFAPKEIPFTEIVSMTPKMLPMSKRLEGFKVDKDGTLKVACKEIKTKQKAAITGIFKRAAVKLLEGKNVVGMSLPINIFQPRSTIERLGDLFSYFPHYCNLASETDDEIKRIKYLTSAVVASCQFQMNQWKPFNPIMGETYHCKYDEDTELFLEHTSHHPAISNFYLKGKKWTCYGAFLYNGKVRPNNVSLFSETWSTLKFEDGRELTFNWPWLKMGNFLIGTRKISMIKLVCVKSKDAKVKCIVKFNKEVKRKMMGLIKETAYNVCHGSIYIYDPIKEQTMIKSKFYDTISSLGKMVDVEQEIETVTGNWLENLCFDDVEYWNVKDYQNGKVHVPVENCLPSSYRFREDLIWLYYKCEKRAGIWKDILENQQRKERKLRKEGKKIRDKENGVVKKNKGFFSMFKSKPK